MTGHIPIINPERQEQGGRLYPGQPLFVQVPFVWLSAQSSPLVSVDRMADVEMVNPRHWAPDVAMRQIRRALERERNENHAANQDAVLAFLSRR